MDVSIAFGVAENVPEPGVLLGGGAGRNPGYFGKSGLDGIDQRVVADDPIEGPGVGLRQEDGSGGHVGEVGQQVGVPYVANAGEPLGIALIWPARVSPVAVVAFVVDDEDVAPLGFAVRNSLDHLGRRFDPGIQLFWRGRTRAAVDDELPLVAGPESQGSGLKLVVVGYLDTGAGQRRFPQVSGWNEVEGLPVIVGVAGVQGVLQPFPDGEAGGEEQESANEFWVLLSRRILIRGLPEDEHGHDRRFAGGGGHLVGDAVDAVVALEIDSLEFLGDVRGAGFPKVDVGQDRVDLGEVKREFLSVGPVVDEFPGCRGGVRVSGLSPG